jgi:acetyl esterase/lipase
MIIRRLATIAALVLAANANAQEAAKPAPAPLAPITLESFAATPFMDDPELSPNGQYLASKVSVDGKQLLAITAIFEGGGKPSSVAIDGSKTSLDAWAWVNDDWLIGWVSANSNVEGDTWRLRRLISVERATGKTTPLQWSGAAQDAADVIWIAKDGTPRILLGVQTSIYTNEIGFWTEVREVDVSTGKAKAIQRPRMHMMNYFADGAGAIRMAYGYDNDNRIGTLLYRSSGKGSFATLDKARYGKDEELTFPALFLPEPDKALTYDDPDGFDAIYELDLKTMQRGKKVFSVPGFDVGGIIETPTGDGVAGYSVVENRPRIHWIDPTMADIQAKFDKAVGEGNAKIVSWDRAMRYLLVKVGGPDQAGAYFLYDRQGTGSMNRIAFVDNVLKNRKFAPMTTIKYKARDGLEISAVLTLPKDKPAKALPLIILPHGGPQVRDYEAWDWWVQYLAWKGYAVIQPNYRGSTGYGNDVFKKGYGEWGLKMQDDLNDAVDHLVAQGMADPKRVCMAGASYGGYAAMRAAQRDGARYRCTISYAGVSDLAAMARYDSRALFGKEWKADLKEKAPDFNSVSPLRAPAQFSSPILIMHGKLDLVVPVSQSRNMVEKLKDAGKPHRYVEQPLGDHHFSRSEDRLQFLREMDAFLNQHNPAN